MKIAEWLWQVADIIWHRIITGLSLNLHVGASEVSWFCPSLYPNTCVLYVATVFLYPFISTLLYCRIFLVAMVEMSLC